MAMRDDVSKFGRISAWLAGIAGLYLGARAVNADWVFFAVLAIAAAIVAIIRFRWIPQAIRAYDPLLKQVAELQEQLEAVKRQLEGASRGRQSDYQAGISEGRAQVWGEIRSYSTDVLPEILAIKDADGTVAFLTPYTSKAGPETGARFFVEDRATGEIKGAVEVSYVDESQGRAELMCVERRVERFWDVLLERASTDSSPPATAHLTFYSVSVEAITSEESGAEEPPEQ
jgi:hypothetical protein